MDSSLHPDVDLLDRPYCHLHDPRQRDRQVNRPLACDPTRLPGNCDSPGLQVILIGPAATVNREILNLYPCGYNLDGWSAPQPIPHTRDVISAYVKR